MKTLKQIKRLSAANRAELHHRLQEAVYHLASCWDALRAAEDVIGDEIEVDDINGATSNVSDPGEAYRLEFESLEANIFS